MASVSGFRCDNPSCNTIVTEGVTRGVRPSGWSRLVVSGDDSGDGFDLCSTLCVLEIAAKRHDAQVEEGESRKHLSRDYNRQRQVRLKAAKAQKEATV